MYIPPYYINTSDFNIAVKYGRLDMIKYFDKIGKCSKNPDIVIAAKNRCIDMIQWLHGNRTEECTTIAMDMAFKNGHI